VSFPSNLSAFEINDLINQAVKTPNSSAQVCPLCQNGSRCDVSSARDITHGIDFACDESVVVCPVRLRLTIQKRVSGV
jgi:hypothetical protein